MTPERFWIAIGLFHLGVLSGLLAFDWKWRPAPLTSAIVKNWGAIWRITAAG